MENTKTFFEKHISLSKVLREFVYFAVKICQRDNCPSATLTFMVWKIFGNQQKHHRRRSAWVGQADFGKLGLNNRNHSENCHHLSLNSKQKINKNKTENKNKQRARSASVRALSLPWTDVDFIIITIHHNSLFFSVTEQSIHNICILKTKVIVLKKQLLRALRRFLCIVVSEAHRTQLTKFAVFFC